MIYYDYIIKYILFIFLSTSSSAYSWNGHHSFSKQSSSSNHEYNQCLDKAGIYNDWARALCASQEAERQEILLQKAYSSASENLASHARKRLAHSQHEWIKQKNRKCALPESTTTLLGTLQIENYQFCLAIENSNRIDWLERKYLNVSDQ